MKFSVLMTTYFNDSFNSFVSAFMSIYHDQILKPDEVVVVLDGPVSVEISEFLKSQNHINLKIIELKKNHGLGYALNKGIINCSNEIVARMDSDDISLPHRFSKIIPFFIENNLDLCGSSVQEFITDSKGKIKTIGIKIMPEKHEECIKLFKYSSAINHPTAILKKSKVISAGNYQNIYLKEDIDLWLRMISIGCKIRNYQSPLLMYRFNNIFKKRSGFKYFDSEKKILALKLKIGIINKIEFYYMIFFSFIIRNSPLSLVRMYYYLFRKIFNN